LGLAGHVSFEALFHGFVAEGPVEGGEIQFARRRRLKNRLDMFVCRVDRIVGGACSPISGREVLAHAGPVLGSFARRCHDIERPFAPALVTMLQFHVGHV
jgi:hypothetical protein